MIIDVFRAFTTACCLVERGSKRIIPVADLHDAFALKEKFPDYLLVGERNGIKLTGADHGNSPSLIRTLDLENQGIIFTTTAGTQGFTSAKNASELISGSFCNAGAIVDYIHQKAPDRVSLVCMGHRNLRPSDEDTLCAEHIKHALSGNPYTQEYVRSKLSASPDAAKFFDPNQAWAPEEDFLLCTQLDAYDFILKYHDKGRFPLLQPIGITS